METKSECCPLCNKEVTFDLKPDPRHGAISTRKLVWIDERGHIKEQMPKP